ncbi:MAG: hypothetical protein ING60_09715 [Rhodocyclaceae bacterium]|jgi:hypothetical protein|nr:hypothetical protein [Rhodocyclaceae bacterium]MCA3060081.1 hypothetical protein [Rhodocyclaceae bacterium]MCA3086535.1 hypothetical protein [Rhodocyclaceae bacterium]
MASAPKNNGRFKCPKSVNDLCEETFIMNLAFRWRACLALILVIGISAAGAEELPVTEKLLQKTGVNLETHIGGQIFKVKRTGPLPNILGKADWFGRTVDKGFLELRFHAFAPDKTVVLRLVDVDTRSNETTMNRNQVETTRLNGEIRTGPGSNTSQISGTATTIRSPAAGVNEILPPNTTEIRLDLNKRRTLKIGTVVLKVDDADEVSLSYSLALADDEGTKK